MLSIVTVPPPGVLFVRIMVELVMLTVKTSKTVA